MPTDNLEERKARVAVGALYSELNTILGRIRRRKSGEPTTAERARIVELQRQIAERKRNV